MDWRLMCRVCLETGDMISLFDWDENNEQLGNKYSYCCGIEVSKNDSLPTHICLNCVDRLTFSYQFKQQCLSSNEKLMEYLEEFEKTSQQVSTSASTSKPIETETITTIPYQMVYPENCLILQYELPVKHDPANQWSLASKSNPVVGAVVTKAPGANKQGRPRKYRNEQGQIDISPYHRKKAKATQKEEESLTSLLASGSLDLKQKPGAVDDDNMPLGGDFPEDDPDFNPAHDSEVEVKKTPKKRGWPRKTKDVSPKKEKKDDDDGDNGEDVLLQETIMAISEPIPDHILNPKLKKKYPYKKKCNYEKTNRNLPSDEEEDEEGEVAYQHVLHNISPLSSISTPPPRLDAGDSSQVPLLTPTPSPAVGGLEVDHRFEIFPTRRQAAAAAPRRGRSGGRAGTRGPGRGRSERNDWARGELYREVCISDEDLCEDVRLEVRKFMAERDERARREQRNRDRMNFVAEDEENHEEEERLFGAQEFIWENMSTWEGRKETFRGETPGPTRVITDPYDAFRSYWDDAILTHIATASNRYAQTIQRERFQHGWYEMNKDEVLILFCFWIMLGVIHMPSIKACFSTSPLLKTETFRKLFSESRYWNINAAFHLNDSSNDNGDPIHSIRPVVDHMNEKFKELYNLEQNIAIDESLTLWKGPLSFKQYIKTKSARFGVKTFQLCESSTGYLWSFFVYVGARTSTSNSALGSSASTVIHLTRPLLNRGHVLFMDNWFNSPHLARHLKKNGTDCVGTLRSHRKQVSIAIQKCPLREGEYIARHSGDVMTVAIQDRKRTTLISTYHDVSQVQKETRKGQPAHHVLSLIDEYNHNMGGVDLMDQKLEPYLIERKQCMKWSKKMLKRMLNISIQNARVLLEKSRGRTIDSLAFRLELISQLMERHLSNVPRAIRESVRRNPDPALLPRRLTERHFISRIEVTEEMQARVAHRTNRGRRVCAVCKRKTVYECRSCEAALCLVRCFETYHTDL
ncbi:hypothetical protein O0L34_g14551 [Tuta absoluta]|nr:hypothetical protein O0L34_g14551 [Tuta absoluta]